MAWVYLLVAGLFEIMWASMMKLSESFTKMNYSIYTLIGMVISFYFLSKAIKVIPLSISYPIWTGIGAVGSVIVGVTLFHDKLSMATWFFVALLLIGLIGIKMTSGH